MTWFVSANFQDNRGIKQRIALVTFAENEKVDSEVLSLINSFNPMLIKKRLLLEKSYLNLNKKAEYAAKIAIFFGENKQEMIFIE